MTPGPEWGPSIPSDFLLCLHCRAPTVAWVEEAAERGFTCKASRMSLSETSVAKDLIPVVLKVACMVLFLSLSSWEQRGNFRLAFARVRRPTRCPPPDKVSQKADLSSLYVELETVREVDMVACLQARRQGVKSQAQ